MPLVVIKDLYKGYRTGAEETKVLVGLGLEADRGEMVMIMGPSGCGKTTLLNLLGGIDRPDGGSITVDGVDVTALDARALNRYRLERVGFIFQFYNLMPTLTAVENVELGIDPVIRDKREMGERARKYLALVDLGDKLDRFPQELSAGEQQRVAIARALAKEPRVVLADEPTGNLDEERAQSVMALMKRLKGELGTTFFIVTHNPALRSFADRTLVLRHGRIERAGA